MDFGDGGDGAVEDPGPVVVAPPDHGVADGEGLVADVELGAGEGAVGGEALSGALVQVVDVGLVEGEHAGVGAVAAGGVPVVHEELADGVRSGGGGDAA